MTSTHSNRFMLWIDGVGAWQLCAGTSFVLGAPAVAGESPDVALLANISRQHATIRHQNNAWYLAAHQTTQVSGQPADNATLLTSGDEICLAESVRLGFRVPSALSTSAVIDFESEHRPSYSVDGVVLLTDHCLLGPRKDQHIWCPDWPDSVILFFRDGQLRCRSKSDLSVNGKIVEDSAIVQHGDTIAGEDFRLRVERKD